MLFLTIRNAILSKNFIQIAFSGLVISLFLTESFLWRQRGVTFFVVMYCVLNAKIKSEKTIANQYNIIITLTFITQYIGKTKS
jgi:O-antigen ligase